MLAAIVFLAAAQSGPKVTDLGFLAGVWAVDDAGGTFEQSWNQPSAGTIIGCGKHTLAEQTLAMEFFSVESREGTLNLFLQEGRPSKAQPRVISFRLESVSEKDKKAVFSNPHNPFPAKITYTRKSDRILHLLLEGTKDDKPHRIEREYKAK